MIVIIISINHNSTSRSLSPPLYPLSLSPHDPRSLLPPRPPVTSGLLNAAGALLGRLKTPRGVRQSQVALRFPNLQKQVGPEQVQLPALDEK